MLEKLFGFNREKAFQIAFRLSEGSLVIRLGLEPRTPTLKVLCSTC